MTQTPTTPPTPPAPPIAALQPPAPKPQAAAGDIYSAILAASAHYGSLERDSNNPYYKSKYLSLPSLLAAVRSALSDQGVIINSSFAQLGPGFVVKTTLRHIPSGTEISSSFPVTDLANPQKVGSSGTFGMRYNLLQLLGIAPEDDDGNSNIPAPGQFMGPDPAGVQRNAPMQQPGHLQQPPDWL
jgi:hypothetical protein